MILGQDNGLSPPSTIHMTTGLDPSVSYSESLAVSHYVQKGHPFNGPHDQLSLTVYLSWCTYSLQHPQNPACATSLSFPNRPTFSLFSLPISNPTNLPTSSKLRSIQIFLNKHTLSPSLGLTISSKASQTLPQETESSICLDYSQSSSTRTPTNLGKG